MIEFRTLGTIELLRPDGTALPSIVSRSKPLGLLAYLAISSPKGPRRRDDVCAVLWPEVDGTRARNSLNQTVHSLRRALGEEAILGGRESVGVDPSLLRCDAVAFASAMADKSFEQALELYGGDLLPGLHIDESVEFERWLDGERRRARTLAFQAARGVSDARRSAGDFPGSVAALRRAREIRPEDDDTVRELIGLLASRSNHAAAIQEFERYSQHLGSEFDLEPPEETRRLVDELKAGNGKGDHGPPIGRSIDSQQSAEVGSPVRVRAIQVGPRQPSVAVGVVAALAVATLLLMTGGVDFMREGSVDDGVVGDPYRVAVLPLRTAIESDRAAAVVLADGLDGWAELRQVEPNRIDARIATEEFRAISPEDGSAIAAEMGAGRFVLVRSERNGADLNTRAVLYGSADSLIALSQVDTTGVASEFAEGWHLDVLLRLFRSQDLGTTPELRSAEWIAEPRAMFPYFTALARFSHGEADSAISYLQQTVALDSTFGAAWDLLAALAMTNVPIATDDWDSRDRLRAIRDTAMIYAERYHTEPEPSVMGLAQARRRAELFPDSAQLQHDVGAQYLRAALERGFDGDSALRYWKRAYELEPRPGRAFRLAILHLEHGRLDEARALLRHAAEISLFVNFGHMMETFLDIVAATSENARDSILYAAQADLIYISNFAVPRTLMMQDSVSIPRHVLETIGGAWYLAPNLELVAGRGSALPGLVMEERRRHDRFRALANVPGLLQEPLDVVSAVRDSVEQALGISWSKPDGYYAHWTYQLHRLWLLGMMSVRLGEFDQASTWVDSMTQLAADSIPADAEPFFVHLGRDLPVEVRAAATAAQGDSEGALALLDTVHTGDELPFLDPVAGDDRAGQPDMQQYVAWRRPFTRLTRGYLLLELGRYEEAEGWFATFPWMIAPHDELLFQAPAFRGRALALDALGRHQEALHYYRRLALRWKDADPHLQPQVEEARRRIREIEAELADDGR